MKARRIETALGGLVALVTPRKDTNLNQSSESFAWKKTIYQYLHSADGLFRYLK